MVEVNTDVKEMGLRDIAKGIVRFSIKADDTPENTQVHDAFKDFCRVETDNNYTQGLRKLLEYYQSDFKYELITNKLVQLDTLLSELKGSIVELAEKPKIEEDEESSF